MTDSASVLARVLDTASPDLRQRWGIVAAVNAAAGTVDVNVGGVPWGSLAALSSYSNPQIGDRVMLLLGGGAPVVVGSSGDERAPRGLVLQGFNNTNSNAWNSTTQVVCQTLSNVPMVAGRAYSITSTVHVGNAGAANVAGDYVVMRHRIGGTQKSTHPFTTIAAVDGLTGNAFTYFTSIDDATTGSHTVDLTGANLSGSGSHRILASSGSNDRCVIFVRDEGLL